MSFQAMTWATEQELPAKEKLVLLMLANCHNHHTNRCDPSHGRLSKECGMSTSSIKRAISELEKKKLIIIRNRKIGDVNLPNSYAFNFGIVGSLRPRVGSEGTEVGSQGAEGWVHSELQNRNNKQEYNYKTIVDDETIDQPTDDFVEEIKSNTNQPKKTKKQNIPYQKIIDIYNRICGGVLPSCAALSPKRKTNIKNCWNLQIKGRYPFQNLDFWEGYFNDCLENKFWCGENDRGWKADIEFVTRTDKALKLLEGE